MKSYRFAVVGATGLVGQQTLKLLAERGIPLGQVNAVASERSVGKPVSYGEKGTLKIASLESFDFKEVDIAFFCTNSVLSRLHAPRVASAGCLVIDKSSFFRLDPKVPLIVPEVNGKRLFTKPKQGIVANPNCVAIPLTMILAPLHQAVGIKRVVVCTYQSTSGAGREGMEELEEQTKAYLMNAACEPKYFPKRIAFNVLPMIDGILANGWSGEEEKIAFEVKKIISPDIKIGLTCVRVPVFIGHAAAIHMELKAELKPSEAKALLEASPGLVVSQRSSDLDFVSPIEVVGETGVYISRLRGDLSVKNSLAMWMSCDNLLKGAALNGLQIADLLLAHHC